jgi:2-aminoadipate transaminase
MNYENLFSRSALNMKSSKIRELMKYSSMPGVISFGGGNPDPDNFPFPDVKDIINGWNDTKIKTAMQYGGTPGYPPLIEKLKSMMKDKKKIDIAKQDLIVTSGGQQAIFLLSRILTDFDDIVLAEEPSFIGGMAAFLANGAKIVGVPVEHDGINVVELEKTLTNLKRENKKPKLLYVIPNFQNPSGVSISQEKRKKLYEISLKHDLLIIEDDPYSELYFSGEEKDYMPIKSIGNEAPIVYLGSFSKILCPGFRLGWMIGDEKLVEKASLAKQSADACSSSFGQMIAYDYLESNAVDGYLKKMRIIYRDKKDLMINKIKEHFPKEVRYTQPEGGFFIYIDLPKGISGQKLFERTIKRNIAFVTGDPFHTDVDEGDSHLRFAYSSVTPDEIEKGIRIIGEELKAMMG